jgi:DNA polymerase-1
VTKDRAEHFKRYGWTVGDANLNTLPPDAPAGAKKLAEWLTLQGRLLRIREWVENYNPDTHCIHGQMKGLGSWTGRMAHNSPNTANIFSSFHDEPVTPVEKVKEKYDTALRSCWAVTPGSYLVGTDAEGIQLRILAHLLKNKDYIEAIVNGKKEDKTDIHNVNMQALGPVCKSKKAAKTFN